MLSLGGAGKDNGDDGKRDRQGGGRDQGGSGPSMLEGAFHRGILRTPRITHNPTHGGVEGAGLVLRNLRPRR